MKRKLILLTILSVLLIFPVLYYVAIFDSMMGATTIQSYELRNIIKLVVSSDSSRKLFFMFFMIGMLAVVYILFGRGSDYKSNQIKVTSKISTPVPAGQGQCGTAKWLDKKDFDNAFGTLELNRKNPIGIMLRQNNLKDIENELIELKQHDGELELEKPAINQSHDDIEKNITKGDDMEKVIFSKGGLVLGKKDVNLFTEKLYCILEDVHTLILGATRCGKTRCLVIQTLLCLALAGENVITTDPKGELHHFLCWVLKLLDYNVITIDFKNPKKSTRYNFLQPIIDYVDEGDIPSAIDATWDLTSQLVGESKGEKLWTDGEASIIAACIMVVVYDNREMENKRYQNLTNVYYFISQMCTPIQVGNASVVPLNKYVKDLPINHPSKGLLSVGEIAPSRTRGSFYTSALMTLKLFTNPLIAEMTSCCDFDAMKVGKEKTAIFIILPDEKKTYHSLASLYVTQQYQLLSRAADLRGGRLQRRVNFICDEFGNFVKIPIFTNMLTVGGGKGIRFNIFLQGFSQLEEVYDKETTRTIKSNCENWVYLQSDDTETLKEVSDKLGKYTITTYSLSSTVGKYTNSSTGQNISLTGRELLMPNEVKDISRPYSLVTSRNDPAIMYAPDLTKWNFNEILGMGDQEHNRMIRIAREKERMQRVVADMELWGIWDKYIECILEEQNKLEEEKAVLAELAARMAGK